MNDDPDPMAPELRSLLRSGAPPLEAPPGASDRVFAALSAAVPTLAAAPAGDALSRSTQLADVADATQFAQGPAIASAAVGSISLGKAAVLAAVACVFGAGAGAGLMHVASEPAPRIVYVDRPPRESQANVVGTAETVAPTPRTIEATALEDSVPAKPRAEASATPSAGTRTTDGLGVERKVLDAAVTAFTRGDSQEALRVIERHADAHPQGQLQEERDALRVRVLADLGRKDEARTRAAAFRARYPQSLLGPAVDSAVGR